MEDTEKELAKKLESLTKAVDRHYLSTRLLIWRSFLQGIFFALGTTVGVSIVLAIITFLINQLELVPFINNFINPSQVKEYIPSK